MLKHLTKGALVLIVGTTIATQATTAFAVTDSELASAQSDKANVQTNIHNLESKLADLNAKSADLQTKKEAIETEAKKIESDIASLNTQINLRKDILAKQARSMQVNKTSTNIVDVLADSKSIPDMIQKVTAMKQITEAHGDLLKNQESDKKTLEKKSKAMQENYGTYLKLSTDIDSQTKDINVQKAELDVASAKYEATIATGKAERDAYNKKANDANAQLNQAKTDANAYANQLANAKNGGSSSFAAANTAISSSNSGSVWDYRGQFLASGSAYNGYAGGGCTDYVWQYFAARGVYIPNVMPGNGKDWSYQMPRAPKLVPGVIASFTGGSHGSSPVYGHVALVEEVYPDGSFKVSEGGGGAWGATRVVPNSSGVTFVLP